MENEQTELQKSISELEVENWRTGLTECSFDKKEWQKIDAPTKEVVGTENERFVVTKREINNGISMVRKFANIAIQPTKFRCADSLTEVFNRSKTFYALVLSVEFSVKSLCYYSDNRLAHHTEELANVNDKLIKLTRFADTVRNELNRIQSTLGDPDVKVEEDEAKPAPRKHDRAPRTTQSRQKPIGKSFSLTNLMVSKRTGP